MWPWTWSWSRLCTGTAQSGCKKVRKKNPKKKKKRENVTPGVRSTLDAIQPSEATIVLNKHADKIVVGTLSLCALETSECANIMIICHVARANRLETTMLCEQPRQTLTQHPLANKMAKLHSCCSDKRPFLIHTCSQDCAIPRTVGGGGGCG